MVAIDVGKSSGRGPTFTCAKVAEKFTVAVIGIKDVDNNKSLKRGAIGAVKTTHRAVQPHVSHCPNQPQITKLSTGRDSSVRNRYCITHSIEIITSSPSL